MIIRNLIAALQVDDTVYVNDIGLFRKQFTASHVSEDKINPPVNSVSLEASADGSGFAFIIFVSKQEQIRIVDADSEIRQWVSELRESLKKKKSVSFEGFGSFSLQKNDELSFTCDYIPELNVEFEGMECVPLPPKVDGKKKTPIVSITNDIVENKVITPIPEPVETESVVPEPVVPEPVETESVVPEPVIPEPIETESVVPEPVVPEPIETESVVPEPVIPEPVETESVVPEPDIVEPVETESVVPEPAETESVVLEPIVPEPVETESVVPEPDIPEPIETESVVPEPVIPEPVETESVVPEPVIPEPIPIQVETPIDNSSIITEERPSQSDEQTTDNQDYHDDTSSDDRINVIAPKPKRKHHFIWLFILVIILVLALLCYLFKAELTDVYNNIMNKNRTTVSDTEIIAPAESGEQDAAIIDEEIDTSFIPETEVMPEEEIQPAEEEAIAPTARQTNSNLQNGNETDNLPEIYFESGKYYVIHGSFISKKECAQHVRQHYFSKYSPKILRQNGNNRMRICLKVCATEAEANAFAANFKDAWVLN